MKRSVLALAVWSAAVTALAGDWPRFRGPTGDGRVTEAQLPLRWTTNENLLWHTARFIASAGNERPASFVAWRSCRTGGPAREDRQAPAA